MRKVLNFVKGRRDDKKGHGSSGSSIGPFSELPSPSDQPTPTDEHCTGLEQKFGYNVDLSGKDKTITKLHKAAWLGNLEKLKVNMKKIDVNVVDELNRTPLHLAAAGGHANIVCFLLGKKANFNICDTEGKTPFLKAVECGHKETIQLMLERGVDINTIDYSGNSGLHIAAKHGFYEIASMLLKQGANFESSNNYGEFPLHIATVAEHKDLVELLLRYGSSVNIVDRENRSPLMFAAKCGSMALAQLFLEYGAQRAVMDSNDWTAEDYALMGGYHDIAAELKSPSERMIMSFTEKSVESQICDTGLASNKRSVSDASLPPDQQEHEKEVTNVTDEQNEDADYSDTWNDSQLSDSSLKQKGVGLKLTKFLPPSSDDEISEESIQSPRMQEMKDEEVQDSPHSCVIPPPCKPPRSWDLIQSGVIDDPKVMEPRRRSLLPLGSLRSRRESFNESPSTAESPSIHGDSLHVGEGDVDQRLGSQSFRRSDDKRDSLTRRHLNLSEREENKDSSSTEYGGIEVKDNGLQLHKEKNEVCLLIGASGDGVLDNIRSSKESLKGSSSNSDWDSDDSLPLDNYPVADVTISPADDSPLKVFRVINPSELHVPDSADDPNNGSPYLWNAEKRSRFLTRAPSIDLTDDDTETGRSKCGHSQKAAELEMNKSDVNISVSGTLGRDGTLLGYEEVWESNAHIPENNVALPVSASSVRDTHILVKEQPEEALVRSSPKFDVTSKALTCSELPKELSENHNTSEDTLLYPSPRFGKSKSIAVSENDVCTESSKNRTYTGDVYRKDNGLKLESHSLDAIEPQMFVPDTKIPRTRKHTRQQSISVQSWNRSEELHEKPPSAAHIDRMIEENQRINAQLRCYDEALRDLAHVSVVRKQSSLSLPRAKEASSLTRSQSAGARNEGFFSLPLASEVGSREMAQSAIVKKQGSLSLPRTSEIPDFAMVQSLGPKKQGHSSLPSTNDFGTREMAQTAIVKRQGSLSLPRTCEIPDFASAANEEYLSLPRSNELIDEAFKEIGQSSVTMKRGSHSLPRSVDAKLISLGVDPVPPPRHKKSSHRRRRAESEGEASDRHLKDAVGRSLSFDVKAQSSNGTEQTAAILNSAVENEVATESTHSLKTDEKHCLVSTSGSSDLKDVNVEKPIRKKRKMLLAMRGFLGQNRKILNGSSVSELSVEGSFDDQPFMMSRDKTGPLERQVTVIERPGFSVKRGDSTTLSPVRLETLEKQELQQQSTVKEHAETLNTQTSSSLLEDDPLLEETARCGQKDDDKVLPDPLQKASPETQSDDAESGLSYSDCTPQHGYIPKGHHNVLKQHLQKATAEKGRLEETAAELGDRAEKLKYELAEAHEAARSRDEVIALLEDQLNNLETLYTKSLEESQRYKLRLGNLEQELKHLKDVCAKHENEKSQLAEIIRLKEMEKLNLDKTLTAKDEEKRLQAITGEKEYEQKQQELEIHVNYLEIENNKLKEEVCKLETKNEDLRQKLNAVVSRNQLLLEEKAAICARNSVDIEILQDHSEKWRQLYETCVENLQLLSSCKPSVDTEAHTRHAEREDFRDEVQVTQRSEEAKEKSYVILHCKIQEDVLNAVQLLNVEYSKVESLLLKQNEKLESVINKLLEILRGPCSIQVPHIESSMETDTAYTAVKQLEDLTLLTSELKEQCQQLQQSLEDVRMKSETLKHSLFTGSEEAAVTEGELRKENVLLKQETTSLLGDNSRALWHELKNENAKLKEQVGVLLGHVQQDEVREVTMKSDQRNGIQAENTELMKHVAELKDQIRKTVGCYDQGIVTDITMFTFGKNVGLNEEDELGHTAGRKLLEQKTMTGPMIWDQNPDHAQELLLELRSENVRLQRQMDSLVQHIKHKEDMISKETMTATMQPPDELLVENMKLKQQITLLMENIKENNVIEQEIMPEHLAYELPEQCRDLLNKLKIENTMLTDQLHLFEVHLKEREAKEDRETMTDPLEWKLVQKYEDETMKLKADMLFSDNKIRQCNKEFNNSGTDFGAVLEENEVEGATWCVSKLCAAMSDKCCSNEAFIKGQNVQKAFDKKLTDQKEVVMEDMLAENRELKGQLASVRLELEKFHIKTMVHEVQSVKTNVHTVQTMTDPGIELVHVSMENAALHAQLQELTGEYKKKSEDLERTLVLLRETREASSFLLKEARDANAHENTLLKKEFEEMKQKRKNQEQEIYKSRTGTTKQHHSAKITELCNLLDYLRKENIDLQAQLKKMLTEKEHKEEDEYGCHNLQQSQEISEDESVGNCDYRVVTKKSLDSLALLISMGYPVSLEEAQHRKAGGIKANNADTLDMAMPSQNVSASTVTNIPAANRDEPKFPIRTDDICKSEQNFGDISLLNKAKQNSQNAESTSQVPIHSNRKKQDLEDTESTKLTISKYPGTSMQITGIGSKREEQGWCIFKNKSQNPSLVSHGKMESDHIPSKLTRKDYVPKLQPALAQGPGMTLKHQQMDKDNSSCSSEVMLDMTCCQNQMLYGLLSENMNSDVASLSKEPAVRANFRSYRDAATNTTPSIQNRELQRELQLEKDKCRKYQQNVKKLKSDVQFLKNKLGEGRKQGKIESNLVLKQNNTNNNSLLTGMQSPSHCESNMAELQRQVAELEQKVREETSLRFALEVQVNKMGCELQEKSQVERELDILRNRLEKDFVSHYEMEQLRNSYEVALSRAKYEAEMAARDDLNEKLCQINTFIEKQVQEQTHLSQLRNTTEAHMKQDFQETRLKLLSELAKVQASLQAKGEEEKELREKCEKLTRECEKKHEIRRKKLIEKSYNVNLAPDSNLKEKELNSKGYMLDVRSPIHQSSPVQPVISSVPSPAVAMTTNISDAWQTEHPFSHILRRELERSIRKHTRTDSLTEHPSTSSPQKASEEHLELLKKKYFLH